MTIKQIDLSPIVAIVSDEIKEVEDTIISSLKSDLPFISTLGRHILKAGGKRLRPLILLLSAKCCGYEGKNHILLSAVIELIHTATLLHDDVVDNSKTRRGNLTANHLWGNASSVLVGDFLYSRAFEIMAKSNNMEVMHLMSKTTNTIATGEIMQLLNSHATDISQKQYIETLRCKTAQLFSASAQIGPLLSKKPASVQSALNRYGENIGIAFQIMDDILDYTGSPESIGKDIGDDIADGKTTLPIIHALKHATKSEKEHLKEAITTGDRKQAPLITSIITKSGSLEYAKKIAGEYVSEAIDSLSQFPEGKHLSALKDIANFSLLRDN